jgi:hypothetical protein
MIVVYCKCKQRASGLFRITPLDGKKPFMRLLCAACAFDQPASVRCDLIRSFTSDIKPTEPKPIVRAECYTKIVQTELNAPPWHPYKPNFATGDFDPNPAWIQSLRNS